MAAQTMKDRGLCDEIGFERQSKRLQNCPPLDSPYETLVDRQKKIHGRYARVSFEEGLDILAVAQRPQTALGLSCVPSMHGQ